MNIQSYPEIEAIEYFKDEETKCAERAIAFLTHECGIKVDGKTVSDLFHSTQSTFRAGTQERIQLCETVYEVDNRKGWEMATEDRFDYLARVFNQTLNVLCQGAEKWQLQRVGSGHDRYGTVAVHSREREKTMSLLGYVPIYGVLSTFTEYYRFGGVTAIFNTAPHHFACVKDDRVVDIIDSVYAHVTHFAEYVFVPEEFGDVFKL